MAKLRDEILEALAETTGLTKKTIRNNISKIRQENALLTPNAAAQVFGKKKGMSFMPKLNPEDKQSLGLYQQAKNITNTFNNTYNTKHDHRNVSVMGETLNNLIIGDNNSGNSQQVGMLEDALSDLLEKVASSDSLTPEEKNDCAAEIGTIASQSKKTTPDKSTIQKAVGQMLYGSGLIK
jgi:hypothetical protein